MKTSKIYMQIIKNIAMQLVPIILVILLSVNTEARYNPGFGNAEIPRRLEYVPGEILVKYRDSVPRSRALSVSRNIGSIKKTIKSFSINQGQAHLISLTTKDSIEQVIQNLRTNPDVEIAQPNFIYRIQSLPNDTKIGQLWAFKNSGQFITSSYTAGNPGTAGKDMNMENAWSLQTDCSSVTVAVVDTGVNYNQEDLSLNMATGIYTCPGGQGVHGCDFSGSGGNDPMDLNGHGTHVAGIIGATGNNGKGVTGVCQSAKILAVKVLDAAGMGSTVDVAEGLNFAIGTNTGEGNAKIVNMSLGGGSYDSYLDNAITTAQNNGVVVVVAAGNSISDHTIYPGYPCDYNQPNIICVAAVNQQYGLADFSDFDSNIDITARSVDIGAPGTNIVSTFAGYESVIHEDFFNTAGAAGGGALDWTELATSANGWGYVYSDCGYLGQSYNILENPSGAGTSWCKDWSTNSSLTIANNVNDIVYKSFNLTVAPLTGYSSYQLEFFVSVDITSSGDIFSGAYNMNGGNPFDLVNGGVEVESITGPFHTYGNFFYVSYDMTPCKNSATCSIGARIQSDNLTNSNLDGIGITLFDILGLDVTKTNYYATFNGTSMASPEVAGIAALLMAHNPDYNDTDVVEAIMKGGDLEASMKNVTRSGRVADAYGALTYIPVTTGVTLTLR